MEDVHDSKKDLEGDEYRNKPNLLIKEKSPYLQQHAFNPVNWMAWGEEAFKKAQKENKPIFLSIGYSTCHWCHVMAHESFEDNEVANLLNDNFISIKVDREERPDIDNIYMTVCQMMTGSGGWPLTILMTPDKKPFYAGTYFPKESRFGRIGLTELLQQIKSMWNNDKKKLLDSSEQITFSLQNMTSEAPGDKLGARTLKRAFKELSIQFDSNKGGFGNHPKFPTPHNIVFLLHHWKRTGNKKALEMVEKTLQEMRKGGIYDHIGFGFHRYSTDSNWLVPHFEKMLYDQSLLTIAYTEAYEATKNQDYSKTAREIITYVLRDMTSPEGGFYSAEDADSEGVEGKFYVWSMDELEKILTSEEVNTIKRVFNVSKEGNYLEEATQRKTGENILHLKENPTLVSPNLDLDEQNLRIQVEEIRQKLYNTRKKRIHPQKDDKILTDWNGLMIVALARASRAYSESSYIKAAKRAVEFILSKMRMPTGRLLHRFREDSAEIEAYLTDYAFLIWGLIEMYEATFEIFFLETAIELNFLLIKHFWDDNIGGFYFTADDGEELLTRQKELYDGAIPSGNSIAMLNLLRLAYLTGNSELEEKADILSRAFSEKVDNSPIAYTQFLVAIDFAVGPSYSLVIAGDSNAEDTNLMLEEIRNQYFPNKVLIHRPTESYPPEIDKFSNYIEWFDKKNDKATAYVCINKTCKPPTTEPKQMLEYLNAEWKAKTSSV